MERRSTIRTDGRTPTISSTTIYTGPIRVSGSEALEAIAVESGDTTSAVSTAAYTINAVALAAPTFSLAPGTYSTSQSVTISDATSGTTIYYTTNGTTPTTISSSIYSGPITVSSSETLEAIAVEPGYTTSSAGSATYTLDPILSPPTFSPMGGTYTTSQTVTLSATAGTTIYYTTNGTTPTTSSSVYGGTAPSPLRRRWKPSRLSRATRPARLGRPPTPSARSFRLPPSRPAVGPTPPRRR